MMRDLITIQKDSRGDNDPQPVYTGPARHVNVPCSIEATSGLEVYRGRQLKAETTHLVTTYALPGVVVDDRLSVLGGWARGKILNVTSIILKDDGGPQMIELHCRELN